MKASWKRFLSLLLVAAMVLSFGATGYAADLDEEIVIVEPEEEINIAEPQDEVPALADGYYLVGTMNGWTPAAEYKFELNPNNSSEYMLATTLTEGAEFKANRVEDGAVAEWIPDGNNYVVPADQAGKVVIYFKPEYEAAWGGNFFVQVAEDPQPAGSLWVGGVEVTQANASDILGDGRASYDFATNTLSFSEAPTISETHEGAVIDAQDVDLTIALPAAGLTADWGEVPVGIRVTGGSLAINGKLNLTVEGDETTAIQVEKGLTANGDLLISASSYVPNGGNNYGIICEDGSVTINGNIQFFSDCAGILCSNGDVVLNGNAFLRPNSETTTSGGIRAPKGSVTISGSFAFSNKGNVAILADGDIIIGDTVAIGDNNVRPGRGLYSENGKIVCEKDAAVYVSTYGICAVNSADGITLKGETNTINNRTSATNPPLNAPCGSVTVTGDLTISGGGLQLILAKNDITIGGSAILTNSLSKTTTNPYNGTIMRSETGSVSITGDCTVKGCADSPLYAYDSFTVGGDVALTFSPHTLRDWGIKAETGAIEIGGKLSSTGKAMAVVLGNTGVTIGKDVSIKNVAEGGEYNYGIQAPNGKITFVSGKWDVETSGMALYAKEGIEIADGYGVTLPALGKVIQLEDGWTVTEPDKTTVAAHVIISDKVDLEDGYYLITPDWTAFDIDPANVFIPNPDNEAEYMLNTTLAVGDEIKVVRVENGAIAGWYPDGENNQYHVDEAHSGDVTVFFKTSYGDGWAAFGGYFYIGAPIESYTVTWVNWDGTVLEVDEKVPAGVVPTYDGATPTRPASAQYTYSFKGWDPEVAAVTADVTYTATYTETERTFFIAFWNYDYSDFLDEVEVAYGETPVYTGPTPTRPGTSQYSYIFKGWSPEIVPATRDADYVATYTRAYLITFVNWDGTVLQSSEVPQGEMPVYNGETPTKPATAQSTYTFKGWDPEIVPANGKATYTAVFEETTNEFTIKFVNDDGTVLQEGKVAYGETPAYTGETPTKAATAQYSYTFKGWTPEIVAVVADATYTATYEETVNEYTIKFVNDDGTVLQEGKVAYGETPAYTGETPTKAATAQYSYTFKGWTPEIAAVVADATYTATYTETVNEYTIKFVNEDGTVLQEGKVAYGETPAYTGETPTKTATAQYSYTFKGWTPEIAAVVADATYTATYTETVNEYTVKFVNDDGTVLQEGKLAYGETPVYSGATPTKAATAQYSYSFKGWTPEIVAVVADATYTATYEETVNEYTVKFVNDDGTVLQEGKVAYGETPVYSGATPTRPDDEENSYTFKGWAPEIAAVVADATYTATYDATPISSFELLDTEITVPAQSEYQLRIEGEAQLTWSSSDEKVATVDENGKVFANLYGKAVITVTDGKKTMSCTVNVLFSDVVDPSYYFAPVYWAAENGITKGYETGKDIGKFGVGFECQRRELLIFLWRYAGEPTVDKDGNPYGNAQDMFNDLGSYGPTTATNKAIAWACTEGITKGYSDGGFHPKASIVRKDVMILLYRLAGKPSVTGTLDFPDCQGSPYTPGTDTYNAILWGSQNAITKGYSDGTFGPLLNCLREQIVTFLYRYDNLD